MEEMGCFYTIAPSYTVLCCDWLDQFCDQIWLRFVHLATIFGGGWNADVFDINDNINLLHGWHSGHSLTTWLNRLLGRVLNPLG